MKRVQQDGQSIKGLVTNHSLHRHTLFGAIAGLAHWYHNDSFSYANWSHNGYRCEQHLNSKRNGAWLYNDNNNALVVGHVMHLLTSIMIGIIFAILITKVSRLKLLDIKWG